MNLFGTILTYAAPSANYRGESAENRAVIQKITKGRFEYPIISPEAMRNALREILAAKGLPCNRSRLGDEEQLAVQFQDYPDHERFADDFFMGWLVAASSGDRKKIKDELKAKGRNPDTFSFKRDSVLRMNLAVALEPYRHDSVFTQSPQDKTSKEQKAHTNTENSQLLHREVAHTAYQYPFALNLDDCKSQQGWTRTLIQALGELNEVAGNHARSYFEMAPASLVLRLTPRLAAGYDNYGFTDNNGKHQFAEVVEGICKGDLPGQEFYLGGKLVRDMDEATQLTLREHGTTLERNPQKLLDQVAEVAFSGAGV